MGAPYDAITIGRWFVAWANADEADLSNMKLQKILYYAQGHHLGRTGTPLFTDPIQAWSHGPVVPPVYRAFKTFGSSDIVLTEDFQWDSVDEETTDLLLDVWKQYGGLAAWRLRDMTHGEAPWVDAFEEGVTHIEITPAAMEQYFKGRS